MSKHLEIATAYTTAVKDGRLDDAIATLQPDALMDSPMGQKKGHDKIKSALGILRRLGGDLPPPVEEDGVVLTRFRTPMGKAMMTFIFKDDLISEIRVK